MLITIKMERDVCIRLRSALILAALPSAFCMDRSAWVLTLVRRRLTQVAALGGCCGKMQTRTFSCRNVLRCNCDPRSALFRTFSLQRTAVSSLGLFRIRNTHIFLLF